MHMTDTLTALQARGDKFTRQLLQEKQRVSQLEIQLKDVNKQVSVIREENKKKAVNLLNMHTTTTNSAYQRVDGLDPTRLAEINQKKLVNNLEGRLNKALVRQSKIQSKNNEIKAKIDKFRRKVQNDSVNRKEVEKRLRQIRDDVDDFMKRAAISSEQRDKIIEQRNQFIRENLEEREKFNEEYLKLSSYINEQNQLLEHSIAMVASDVAAKVNKLDEDSEEDANPAEEIKALDEKIAELDRQYEANREILKQTEEKNKTYEEAFRRLQEVTGLTSTESIIKAFVQNEEESFSLFNYIQTVNQECDSILEEHGKLNSEVEKHMEDQKEQQSKRRNAATNYNKRLGYTQVENQRLREASRQGKLIVLQISKKVQSLYTNLRCLDMAGNLKVDNSPKAKNLAMAEDDRRLTMFTGEQISERNILDHMEQIERRAIQIIAEYAKSLANGNRRGRRRPSVLLSPKSFDHSLRTANTATSKETFASEDSDTDDSDSGNGRPVSVHDMRKQAAEKMKKPQTPDAKQSHFRSFFQ